MSDYVSVVQTIVQVLHRQIGAVETHPIGIVVWAFFLEMVTSDWRHSGLPPLQLRLHYWRCGGRPQ